MKEWFLRLQPRERMILMGGTAAAAFVILWGILWMPLQSRTVELREAVADKTRLYADLQRAESLGGDSPGNPSTSAGQSLVVLVDSTAQSLGLAGTFTRTRPDGPDAISVSFQSANFDSLLTWLISLERSYGVSVESASFNGSRDAGIVSGQIFLRRF